MRALFVYPLAVLASFLPKRYWEDIDLPIANVAPASALLTLLVGVAVGIRGYFEFLDMLRHSNMPSILDVAKMQVEGKLPETVEVSAIPGGLYATAPIAFALFTPLGLAATYLVVSGMARIISGWVGAPSGDPLLTGIDTLGDKLLTRRQQRAVRVAREQLEKIDEPDRRYDGEWAGLTGVDFVIVAARRKPGWTKGTWVVTSDGWFTLGEPFDRPMPNGLRTVYPLTLQTSTLEVLRKGVSYELPPLRKTPGRPASQQAGATDRESK